MFKDKVTFTGALPANKVLEWYHKATIAVNLSPVGLFDKAPLESMACGIPTIVSNPAFDSLNEDYAGLLQLDSPEDVDNLARQINGILAMSANGREHMGKTLQDNVVDQHSLQSLVTKLVPILERGTVPSEFRANH